MNTNVTVHARYIYNIYYITVSTIININLLDVKKDITFRESIILKKAYFKQISNTYF
jgi:hypothetical protein